MIDHCLAQYKSLLKDLPHEVIIATKLKLEFSLASVKLLRCVSIEPKLDSECMS
jgi:hypothetical protein